MSLILTSRDTDWQSIKISKTSLSQSTNFVLRTCQVDMIISVDYSILDRHVSRYKTGQIAFYVNIYEWVNPKMLFSVIHNVTSTISHAYV